MDSFLTRFSHDLLCRVEGPMKLRLLIQPLAGFILAVRAGLRDARESKPPYFWALAFDADHRRELLGQGWKDIAQLFVVAVVLDIIYQFVELHMVYPGEAIAVAIVLAIIPYLVVRASVGRLFRKKRAQP